jgi:hypothetical protein
MSNTKIQISNKFQIIKEKTKDALSSAFIFNLSNLHIHLAFEL